MFVFEFEEVGEGLDGPLQTVIFGMYERELGLMTQKKSKKYKKLILVINLRSQKNENGEEKKNQQMEAYEYPLISQPNLVHYATWFWISILSV
jgi:hypothetical protein